MAQAQTRNLDRELDEPCETRAVPPLRPVLASSEFRTEPSPSPRITPARWLSAVWIVFLLTLYGLHFPHLLADFPNHSPWMDYAKYTDEGWYGTAAIRYTLTGHWYLRGAFNPAVVLPVWPMLLAGVFHCTSVSLLADRILALVFFGLDLLLAWSVVRSQSERWVALLAVTMLAASPFFWAFSRLAILESPLIGFVLLSWLLALRLPRASARMRTAMLVAIGLVLWLAILTKTTAIFVLPSTLFLIVHPCRTRIAALCACAVATMATALPWCLWYFLLVRPRYPADYQYFFQANRWPLPTTFMGWLGASWWALHGLLWISPALCATAAALLLLALTPRKMPAPQPAESQSSTLSFWRNPLTAASLLAIAGYLFFIGWHDNPQPRYYEMIGYPLIFLLTLAIADLLDRSHRLLRLCGFASIAVVAAVALTGVFRITGYLRHPEYTFLNAARGVARTIDQHPGPHRLLLSISGDDIELITGLPTLCDDFGAWPLPERMRTYQPGWYAAWNEIDPKTLANIQTLDSLLPVASFPAFDDPDRNVLILYRLLPLAPVRSTRNDPEAAIRKSRGGLP